ncbi:hypothetical protein DYB32_003867 [Aphanomyces invadans]|uniref:E2F-associated phosphoprotein n=1 Tax=Aphanomyces invadans TaxID=157072 RepID=A0A3R6Z4E8_9STRA|nr:hypothetical protein DYB32_003867 [Aphanomyces invadans]
MPTPFEERMAKMLLALDAVTLSKGDFDHDMESAALGGHRYFPETHAPPDDTNPVFEGDDDQFEEAEVLPPGRKTSDSTPVVEQEEVELYGDAVDDYDDAYVSKNLRGEIDPDTDAALACPCCFMIVSYASQRHEKYDTQYRASKAVNCRINTERTFVYDNQKLAPAAPSTESEVYVAVECSDCNTVVGVKLQAPATEPTIHFFHVLPSHI